MVQQTFTGYAITSEDPKKWKDMVKVDYKSKNWEETDVEVKITHCGVCGSDVHTLDHGWGKLAPPVVAGHEIVGIATRVGSQVDTGIKVGDRVGVGAQIASCYTCKLCTNQNENYCAKKIDTYADNYPDGVATQGGYSTGIIANKLYVFPIPDSLPSEAAASMLCAGLTTYSPLVRHGAGPGKKVAVIGVGGLGHYAIIFGNALGAEVTAFSRQEDKLADAKKLGAAHAVHAVGDNFADPYALEFDLIISTADVTEKFPLDAYMKTLNVHGKFVTCGLPDHPFPGLEGMALSKNGAFFGGTHLGNRAEMLAMLKLAADKGLRPWITVIPMKDVATALQNVKDNHVRYRYVLTADIDGPAGLDAAEATAKEKTLFQSAKEAVGL